MKMRECPVCNKKVPVNNKGKRQRHERWDWPGYPIPDFKSSTMYEIPCEGSEL